jgi:hypothetical protein
MDRPPTLNIGELGDINHTAFKGKTYGGTLKQPNYKSKNGKKVDVADCFKKDTVKVHTNKGGDGFEAWKGNRKVIKKLKIGKRVEYQTSVPRDGKYAQPF